MDIKTAPFHGPFGDHELTVTVCSYAVNKRLAVNLLHKGFLFFTPILLISGFTVWENTAAKLAESTPRKPGVVGRNGAGKLLVCHCSSGQNNVVVTEFAASGFTVVGRPGIYST